MHILQSGLPKSGNFWLYQIISNIFEKAKLEEKSFIKNQPIHKVAQTWDMGVKGQIDINFLDILERENCTMVRDFFSITKSTSFKFSSTIIRSIKLSY
jgi:aryl sulfotransferase